MGGHSVLLPSLCRDLTRPSQSWCISLPCRTFSSYAHSGCQRCGRMSLRRSVRLSLSLSLTSDPIFCRVVDDAFLCAKCSCQDFQLLAIKDPDNDPIRPNLRPDCAGYSALVSFLDGPKQWSKLLFLFFRKIDFQHFHSPVNNSSKPCRHFLACFASVVARLAQALKRASEQRRVSPMGRHVICHSGDPCAAIGHAIGAHGVRPKLIGAPLAPSMVVPAICWRHRIGAPAAGLHGLHLAFWHGLQS